MTFSYFLVFHDAERPGRRIDEADRARVTEIVATTPALQRGLVYTPESASDPYLDDGASPPLALQLYFADLPALEAAVAVDGHLQALAQPANLPSLAGTAPLQQAMVARSFPVPDPRFDTRSRELPCTYLVHYPGKADDLNLWLAHYYAYHAPLMTRFPGIREVEVATRLDWVGFLPFPRANYMQRNKVVFDSAAALTAALNSPIRHEMRDDFNRFPPYEGSNIHYPMATLTITP
jgi:uncharacterized protein (TIGR02118 family)